MHTLSTDVEATEQPSKTADVSISYTKDDLDIALFLLALSAGSESQANLGTSAHPKETSVNENEKCNISNVSSADSMDISGIGHVTSNTAKSSDEAACHRIDQDVAASPTSDSEIVFAEHLAGENFYSATK